MSTPTASNLPQPGSASKKPTGHVTTPSHMGVASPAPRSIPSPAAIRKDQAGKTPVNHPTVSSQGSKTLYGTPMVPSLSQTGMGSGSSPGQNASFGTPGALAGLGIGVDMGSATPGQFKDLTPGMSGSAAMMPTMSDLGFGASSSKRNEDQERSAKLRKILKSIGKSKGRISEEGIGRMARRVGWDENVEGNQGKKEALDRPKLVGNRLITLIGKNGGKNAFVDITQTQHVVQGVDVTIQCRGEKLHEQSKAASEVLFHDLKVPDGTALNSSLDRFATSLESLAKLDRLSTGVNCFEAIDGLYKSLRRLREREIKAALNTDGESNKSAARAEMDVLCKRSGNATMHAKGKIGLAIEYWTNKPTVQEDAAMDIDSTDSANDPLDGIYALRIEAESFPANIYTPLRISGDWLPESFEVPDPASGQPLPWQDPPQTFLSQNTNLADGDAMAIDDTQQLPDLRFVAKLDPPVVVPYYIAANMLSCVNMPAPQVDFAMHYHTLLLGTPAPAVYAGTVGPIEAEQTVLAMQGDQEVEVKHHYTLEVSKPDWGFKLDKLPFYHPRQLVELLPHLRQWAYIGELMRNTFGSNPTGSNDKPLVPGPDARGVNGIDDRLTNVELSVDDLLAKPKLSKIDDDLSVNIGLITSPQPTITLTYPDPVAMGVKSTTVQVQANADTVVTHFDSGEADAIDADQDRAARLAKAFALCSDIGVWLEWMRYTM